MRRSWVLLAPVLLLAAGLRLRYFTGLQVGDDIVYSRIAADRARGVWEVTNVHAARHGFLLPITACYAVWGPGEASLLAYNFLCSLGLVGVAFFLARKMFGAAAGLIAAVGVAVHPLLVFYSTEGHTDIALSFWTGLAMLLFLRARESPRAARLLWATGFLLGWTYLQKEAVLALIPFFVVHTFFTRYRWTWHLPLAFGWLAVILAESVLYGILCGSPFHRWELIRHQHTEGYLLAAYRTPGSVFFRMVLELPGKLFLFYWEEPHYWHRLLNLTALLAAGALWIRREPGVRFLTGWFLSIYAFYSFGPSSLSPLLPGFFLFDWTLPALIVPLMCGLAGWLQSGPRWVFGIALVFFCAAAVHLNRPHARQWGESPREAYRWIEAERPATVVTDEKSVEAFDFFDQHRPTRRYVTLEGSPPPSSVVIVDKYRTQPNRWWTVEIPSEARHPPPHWTKAYESDRVVIYRIAP